MTTPENEPVDLPAWLADHDAQPVSEDYEAPVWTAEESNEANDGYTQKTWLEQEAMFNRTDEPAPKTRRKRS